MNFAFTSPISFVLTFFSVDIFAASVQVTKAHYYKHMYTSGYIYTLHIRPVAMNWDTATNINNHLFAYNTRINANTKLVSSFPIVREHCTTIIIIYNCLQK